MRTPRSKASLTISFGLGLLAASVSAAETGAESVYGPGAGELVVGTRANPGDTPEPVRYRYAYGETDGSSAGESEVVDGIIGALPENSTEPHVIDVFAEKTPEGLMKGRALAARLRAYAKSLRAKRGARADRIAVDVVAVPVELAEAESRAVAGAEHRLDAVAEVAGKPAFAKEFRQALVRPTERTIRTGAIVGTYRGITSFTTWFSTPGIHPLAATAIATFQTSVSVFHGVFAHSISNVFNLNLKTAGRPIRNGTFFVRNQIYGIILTEMMRLLSGNPPGFDPMNTLAGQAQIITLSVGLGALDTLLCRARDTAFLHDPVRFARIYLANFFLLVPWQMMDVAGTFPVLLDLTIYKIRGSTIGMLATYFGLYQSISRAPGKTAFVLDAVFDPAERILGRVQGAVGRTCKSLLSTAEDFGNAFRDFVR